jgi:AAA family ATP:ADP antiporter
LGRIRETSPQLDYGDRQIRDLILTEAHQYYQLYAAVTRFRETRPGGKATALLARTIEERLTQTIERQFRLLGLRYPPKQIQAAYLVVSQRRREEFATALEFLDNILEHDLKSVLLPMIDGSPHLLDIGREQFGVEVPSLETALMQQVLAEDTWLVACAVAAVAELQLKSLAGRVRELANAGDPVVAPVAERAAAALA